MHWIAAYLVAIGLVGWMLAGGDSTIEVAARCASIAIGTVGALLVTAQGIGLVAWLLTRGRTPGWYRVVLAIAALFVTPLVLLLTFALGAFDMALRPRRRAANSARIPGRGSEG